MDKGIHIFYSLKPPGFTEYIFEQQDSLKMVEPMYFFPCLSCFP